MNTDLIRLFSTLPLLSETPDNTLRLRVCFTSIPKLAQNLTTLLTNEPSFTEDQLIIKFFKDLRKPPLDSLANDHLVCYLSRIGFQTAKKMYRELDNFGKLSDDRTSFFHDLIQKALAIASDINNVLKYFELKNVNHELILSMRCYFKQRIYGLLLEEIRTKEKIRTFKRSNWFLLKNTTQKGLVNALKRQNYTEPLLGHYLLAWKGFKAVYVTTPRDNITQLKPPNPEQLKAIVEFYHKSLPKSKLEKLPFAVTVTQIDTWLKEMISAVRTYLDLPTTTTLNSPLFSSQDGKTTEFIDILEDERYSSCIFETVYLTQELKEFVIFVSNLVEEELINKKRETLPLFYYGLSMTYQEIVIDINEQVYYTTLLRRLERLKLDLTKKLLKWRNPSREFSLKDLENIKALIGEYLTDYYYQLIYGFYQQGCETVKVKTLNLLSKEVEVKIETRLDIQIEETHIAKQKIEEKVDKFLANQGA